MNGIGIRQIKLVTVLASAVLLAAVATPAEARSGVRIGSLKCSISGGVGLVLGSNRSMSCVFYPTSGKSERYSGRIIRAGLDIGITSKSKMVWAVFAPGKMKRGALAGSYGGVSAQATVGVGLGANVLVGGFRKSIALQPLSVQAQSGLNVAAGIASLRLSYSGK